MSQIIGKEMVVISFTISKIFAVAMYMSTSLTFRTGQGKVYSNLKPIHDFLFDGNGTVTISRIFAVILCTALTVTFILSQDHKQVCQSKANVRLPT